MMYQPTCSRFNTLTAFGALAHVPLSSPAALGWQLCAQLFQKQLAVGRFGGSQVLGLPACVWRLCCSFLLWS